MVQSLYHVDLDPQNLSGFLKYSSPLFHLSGFDETTVTSAVISYFTSQGCAETKIEVIWVDAVSLFVHLSTDEEEVTNMLALNDIAHDTTNLPHPSMGSIDILAMRLLPLLTKSAPAGWKIKSHYQFCHGSSEVVENSAAENLQEIVADDSSVTLKRALEVSVTDNAEVS